MCAALRVGADCRKTRPTRCSCGGPLVVAASKPASNAVWTSITPSMFPTNCRYSSFVKLKEKFRKIAGARKALIGFYGVKKMKWIDPREASSVGIGTPLFHCPSHNQRKIGMGTSSNLIRRTTFQNFKNPIYFHNDNTSKRPSFYRRYFDISTFQEL